MFCGLVVLDPRHTFILWVMQASWKCSWKFKRIKVLVIENQQGKFMGGEENEKIILHFFEQVKINVLKNVSFYF